VDTLEHMDPTHRLGVSGPGAPCVPLLGGGRVASAHSDMGHSNFQEFPPPSPQGLWLVRCGAVIVARSAHPNDCIYATKTMRGLQMVRFVAVRPIFGGLNTSTLAT
jgi:hypothetical protein